jgi:hypothetical protein
MTAPTDPKVIAAILAEFKETVAEGAKLATLRMLGDVPPPPLTAGARPNTVDDNSIEHGGVGGWNR